MLLSISQGSLFKAATMRRGSEEQTWSEQTPLKHRSQHVMSPGHVRQASVWEAWSTAATSAGGTGRTARAGGTGGRMSGIATGGWTMTGLALLPAAFRP